MMLLDPDILIAFHTTFNPDIVDLNPVFNTG